MNPTRSDLGWALKAVLPHVGVAEGASVYLSEGKVWATDNYSAGVATVPGMSDSLTLRIRKGEAEEMMRFIRPTIRQTEVEEVILRVDGAELHVGLADSQQTAVFDLSPVEKDVPTAIGALIDAIVLAPAEWDKLVYQPNLFVRFAKAERVRGDRMVLHPKRVLDRNGVALVYVGDNFTGAVAGMAYEATESESAA